MYSILAASLALSLPCFSAFDDEEPTGDDPLEGHSHQGDAFNEGPRQAAYLMPDPGSVYFPVSTESGEAQAFFTQGVGDLHGFRFSARRRRRRLRF